MSAASSAFDVRATTNRGQVTLTGEVPTQDTRLLAEAIAQDTSGVTAVHNQLTVNPATRGSQDVGAAPSGSTNAPQSADDRLAWRVEFELYSTRALPLDNVQIHSQDGTVYLAGPVTSRAEKLLAERVTQSVDGVKRVVNNLTAPESSATR